MAEHKDPIVYRYKPTAPGQSFPDVPPRDLRQSDVDALVGEALRHVTLPDVEHPIYVPVEHRKDDAKKPASKSAAKSAGTKAAKAKAEPAHPTEPTTEAVVIAAVPPSGDAGSDQKGGD